MKNDDLSCKTAVIPHAVVVGANFLRYPHKIKKRLHAAMGYDRRSLLSAAWQSQTAIKYS